MPKQSVYILGPVSSWNADRKKNFEQAAEQISKLDFTVTSCLDFMSDETIKSNDLFKKRLNAAMGSEHVVLLDGWSNDSSATTIRNAARHTDAIVQGFAPFIEKFTPKPEPEKKEEKKTEPQPEAKQ